MQIRAPLNSVSGNRVIVLEAVGVARPQTDSTYFPQQSSSVLWCTIFYNINLMPNANAALMNEKYCRQNQSCDLSPAFLSV